MKTAVFVVFWILTILLALDQVGWLYQAYFRPRRELRVLLEEIPEGIKIVGHRSGVGRHGGTMLWNFHLSSQAATVLRARCASPGFLRPLDRDFSVAPADRTAAQPKLPNDHRRAVSKYSAANVRARARMITRPRSCRVPGIVVGSLAASVTQ
jgi:hypothetical protein